MRFILLAILFILISIFCVYLAFLNPMHVPVSIPFLGYYPDVPLIVVILSSVLLGSALSFLTVLVRDARRSIHLWAETRQAKKREILDRRYNEGLDLQASGRISEAIDSFEDVLSQSHGHVGAASALGDIHYSRQEWEKAAAYHRQALSRSPKSPRIMLNLARDYSHAGDLEEALEVLQRLISLDENNLSAHQQLRDIYIQGGKWQRAIGTQRRILSLIKKSKSRRVEEEILLGLKCEAAKSLMEQGNAPEALRILKKILRINKEFVPAYKQLSEVYQRQGNLEAAMELVGRGYEINPSVVLLKRLEELALAKEDPQRAISAYRQAIEKNPADYQLNISLGMLYLKLEMLEEAERQLMFIMRQDKDVPLVHYLLAETLTHQKRYDKAAEEYRRACRIKDGGLLKYTCKHCGYTAIQWSASCPKCSRWDCLEWKI